MIVWRITGNEIGPGGNGAAYYATKREADAALLDYRTDADGKLVEELVYSSDLPERLVVKDRRALAYYLNDAMGYGAS